MIIEVLNIDTPSLGDRSYLVHDGKTALVIDPQRDIDRINDLLSEKQLILGAVAETHMHNDYVSGGLELTEQHGAAYLTNAEDPVGFERIAVKDQEVMSVGTFALKAIATPGHTYTHLSYALLTPQSETIGIFTGGSLLHGATGRPDLLGWDHAAELAGLQHQSARELSEMLESGVEVYPTHGFGSFCAATPSLTDNSNIGEEQRTNPVFLLDVDHYIAMTLASLDIYPDYFKYMGPINTAGAKPIDLTPLALKSVTEISNAINSGAWVVDLRDRKLWAKEHLFGSTSLGIDGSLASYLGWVYPYGKELFLLSDNQNDITKGQRELARIGIDRPNGSYVGPSSAFSSKGSVRVATFSEYADVIGNPNITLLDVRQVQERTKSHINGSIFIPFYEVEARVEELPKSDEIWVHCASGYRAASILRFIETSGRTAILINEDYAAAGFVDGLSILF